MGLSLVALFASATIEFNLPPKLLNSICFVESNYRTNVIHKDDGDGNSIGVCQIQLRTAAYMGYKGTEKGLLVPQVNIHYSAKYFRHQFNRYGDWNKAIAAYNAGSFRSDRTGKPFNQKYVNRVWRAYGEHKP